MKKKKRNQLKKVSRNQRTKIKKKEKMRMKMNSIVSIPTSKFGKVSCFVNQRGSVPYTDTEMFGCEIVRDLPDYVNDFVKQIGFDVVIKVPLSNPEGLTGSGENGECHLNSRMMSLSIGGNRILGYSIIIMKKQKKLCFLHGHSVWNTPEGKTRCVTQDLTPPDFNDKLLMGDTVLFIPVGMNWIDRDNQFWLDNFIIYEGDNSFCLKYLKEKPHEVLENQKRYVMMRTVLERKLENKGHIFSRCKWEKMTKSQMVKEIKESHFGKVSLFSGRSWDYYKNKILNTYFPTPQTL